jgi:HSP20 family protein
MPNITVQKQSLPYPFVGAEDPIQMFRELFNWAPRHHLLAPATFAPAFEVRETTDRYVFKADMPGVKDPDLEINVTGNRLSVSGKRETEQIESSDTVYAEERSFGAFARSFVLPEGADLAHVQAALREGVLTIVIPKSAEVKPRKIPLETGGKLRA